MFQSSWALKRPPTGHVKFFTSNLQFKKKKKKLYIQDIHWRSFSNTVTFQSSQGHWKWKTVAKQWGEAETSGKERKAVQAGRPSRKWYFLTQSVRGAESVDILIGVEVEPIFLTADPIADLCAHTHTHPQFKFYYTIKLSNEFKSKINNRTKVSDLRILVSVPGHITLMVYSGWIYNL